ncbi:Srd anti-sigma factor [Acinetobacter phage vB_ApiM_fHyAci03]|uniref:Putative anti-sigma factor n=1 Tax=Acinetobacter phage vB_ApiM_fHyAci03 TaxID=2269366 RepID=A0A345AUL4_9CAUD|nr:Srd anti-sigma factor [Acinetobacter phage vB_ApiM_fHyAci03]AXF40597.1 putative anti-sigma factor [Acinetobacter phage vB_ApiM_fHyAci03]
MISNIKIAECFVNKAKNAKLRGIKFDMSLSTFANIKHQTLCAYSGMPFEENETASMSLERIDNTIGYIDGNVIPVRRELNTLRSDLTSDTIDARINELNSMAITKEAEVTFHSIAIGTITAANALKDAVNKEYNKPKIHPKHLPRWKKLLEVHENTKASYERRIALIRETEATLIAKNGQPVGKAKAKKINRLLTVHTEKAESLKSALLASAKALNKFYKNCATSNGETLNLKPIEFKAATNEISYHENAISRLKNELEKIYYNMHRLKTIIKPALIKFENLSDGDKARIKLGLPLSTPTYKLLKHKVGYNCLINKI